MSDALVAACEALLFVAAEPLALHELAAAAEADEESVERALDELERRLEERGAGVVLDRAGARFGLRAAPGGPAEAAAVCRRARRSAVSARRRSRRSPSSPTCSRSAGPRSPASAASRPTPSSPACSSAS